MDQQTIQALTTAMRGALQGSPGVQQGRAWNMSVLNYSQGQRITIQKNCFAMMVGQFGDQFASANGWPLFPNATPAAAAGDVITFAGHMLDIYKGKLDIAFSGAGAAPNVIVVQLFYLEGNGVKDNV